ncbi:MAG: hypothetical protein M1840_001270 [Geoglossum simile]|nr:MAG: hypothetical protein M1840_001270 [Geoglossum simile]
MAKLTVDSAHDVYSQPAAEVERSRSPSELASMALNRTNYMGESPLYLAVRHGNLELIELMLSRGADPNAEDIRGETPLYVAVQLGHYETVKMLLSYGADQTIQSRVSSNTPVLVAAGMGSVKLVALLTFQGAVPCSANVQARLLSAAMNGNDEVVQALLDCGADPNIKNPDGKTPLFLAAMRGHAKVVELLLVEGGHAETVDLLLAKGVDRTPKCNKLLLTSAARNGNFGIVNALLESGANPDPKSSYGGTPLFLAVMGGHAEVVKLLLAKGANGTIECKRTLLSFAAGNGNFTIVDTLLESGAPPNYKDDDGRAPILYAAMEGHQEIVDLLVSCGADPNCEDDDGRTPVLYAAMEGHQEIMNLLLERGSNINYRGKDGKTPLLHAIIDGDLRAVNSLLKMKADPDDKSDDGTTPLFCATLMDHRGIMYLLRERGAAVSQIEVDRVTRW